MVELSCKQTEKLILQFIKDEMDERTKKQFLEHVESFPSCLEELSIQFLVTTGMQRLENGDTFDLNAIFMCWIPCSTGCMRRRRWRSLRRC